MVDTWSFLAIERQRCSRSKMKSAIVLLALFSIALAAPGKWDDYEPNVKGHRTYNKKEYDPHAHYDPHYDPHYHYDPHAHHYDPHAHHYDPHAHHYDPHHHHHEKEVPVIEEKTTEAVIVVNEEVEDEVKVVETSESETAGDSVDVKAEAEDNNAAAEVEEKIEEEAATEMATEKITTEKITTTTDSYHNHHKKHGHCTESEEELGLDLKPPHTGHSWHHDTEEHVKGRPNKRPHIW